MKLIGVLVTAILLISTAFAQTDEPVLVLKGLDAVALVQGKKITGENAISVERGRFKYLFASQANKQKFEEGAKKGISLVSGHALHQTKSEHIKQVTNGEDDKMPAFRDKLSVEEIKHVVAYVRNDFQKNASRDASHQHKN